MRTRSPAHAAFGNAIREIRKRRGMELVPIPTTDPEHPKPANALSVRLWAVDLADDLTH